MKFSLSSTVVLCTDGSVNDGYQLLPLSMLNIVVFIYGNKSSGNREHDRRLKQKSYSCVPLSLNMRFPSSINNSEVNNSSILPA